MSQFSRPNSGAWRVRVAFVAAACASLAGVSHAQHEHAVPTLQTPSPVPLKFDSVLSRYKPMTDQKLGSWREANDTVARIGGWRAYLKESQSPEAVAPGAPSAAAVPGPVAPTKPNPHAGHEAKP